MKYHKLSATEVGDLRAAIEQFITIIPKQKREFRRKLEMLHWELYGKQYLD